ncbi:MAG: transcription antitermination factor NusB [Planctomycetes bacterium]|nr:transcription antitermination factor NusB [Planctomycetota bacterium]
MVDARGDEALLGVDDFLKDEAPDEAEAHEFARQLLSGTLDNQEEIDKAISGAAQNWHLRRMAIVDRNILRMAVYEMLFLKDIPAKVSINEAIEMGKRFSTQQSGAFINGILDRIRRERNL